MQVSKGYATFAQFFCTEINDHSIYLFNQQKQSTFANVNFFGIKILTIYGKSPAFKNVTLQSKTGLTLYETRNDKLSSFKHVLVKHVEDTAFSFINIHNVTVSHSRFSQLNNGIFWKNQNYNFTAPIISNWSILYFCSAAPIYKFDEYNNGIWIVNSWYKGQLSSGCSRSFEAMEGYQVEIRGYCKARYSDWCKIGKFQVFDDETGKILLRDGYAKGEFIFKTEKRKIRMEILNRIDYYQHLMIAQVKLQTDGCNFEKTLCGWTTSLIKKNGVSNFIMKRITSNYGSFHKPLLNDLDYPVLKKGYYFAFHNNVNRYNAYVCKRNFVYGSIGKFIGEYINSEKKICTLEFYAYEIFPVTYKHEKFEVKVEYDSKIELIKSIKLENQWKFYQISLDHLRNKNFRIIFEVSFMDYCESIIGIDKVNFIPCKDNNELMISTLDINTNHFQDCMQNCIKIDVNSINPYNYFKFEKNNFSNKFFWLNSSLIDINVNESNVFIKNSKIHSASNLKMININFNSKRNSSKVFIQQNSIVDSDSQNILSLSEVGTGQNSIVIDRLEVVNCTTNNSIINLKNMDIEMKNMFIQENKIGGHLLQIDGVDSEYEYKRIHVKNSTFIFNKKISPQYNKYAIIRSENQNFKLNYNILKNPLFNYELSTYLKSYVNDPFENNWWGTTDLKKINRKIKVLSSRFYGNVTVTNILNMPPEGSPYIIGCTTGWYLVNGFCYYFHMGTGSLAEASAWCNANGGFLIAEETLLMNEKVNQLTKYIDLSGRTKSTEIWTIDSSDDIGEFRPWICSQPFISPCPFNCLGRGVCVGRQCLCNDGWTGEYCSEFHCNRVSKCMNRGQCVGPNECSCNPGWHGSNCGTSSCSKYTNCNQCTNHNGCGWCDSSRKCEPGSPVVSINSCKSWFYWNCVSVSASVCSDNIQNVNCDLQFCNSTNDNGFCQECKDLSKCYTKLSGNCKTWDEKICRGGVLKLDLYEKSRPKSIKLKSRVKELSKLTAIYNCDMHAQEIGFNDPKINLFMLKDNSLPLPTGSILLNSELNIMHQIQKKWIFLNYTAILGKLADIDQVLDYAHLGLRATFNLRKSNQFFYDIPSNEQLKKLEESFLKFTKFEDTNINIIKCLGKQYIFKGKIIWSYYFLTSYASSNRGDILVYKGPNGFLERITNYIEDNSNIFVETEKINCSNYQFKNNETLSFNNLLKISSNLNCKESDGLNEIYYFEKGKFDETFIEKGDFALGKNSSTSVGLVLGKEIIENEWNMYEVVDLFSISPNLDQINTDDLKIFTSEENEKLNDSLNNELVKKMDFNKEIIVSFFLINHFFYSSVFQVSNLTFNSLGSVELRNKIDVELKISPYSSILEFMTIKYHGSLKYDVNFSINSSSSEKSDFDLPNTYLSDKADIKHQFFIDLLGISIPGSFSIENLKLKSGKILFNRETDLKINANFTSDYKIGSSFLQNKEFKMTGHGYLLNNDKSSIVGKFSNEGDLNLVLEPSISIAWPDFSTLKKNNAKEFLEENNTNFLKDSLLGQLKSMLFLYYLPLFYFFLSFLIFNKIFIYILHQIRFEHFIRKSV